MHRYRAGSAAVITAAAAGIVAAAAGVAVSSAAPSHAAPLPASASAAAPEIGWDALFAASAVAPAVQIYEHVDTLTVHYTTGPGDPPPTVEGQQYVLRRLHSAAEMNPEARHYVIVGVVLPELMAVRTLEPGAYTQQTPLDPVTGEPEIWAPGGVPGPPSGLDIIHMAGPAGPADGWATATNHAYAPFAGSLRPGAPAGTLAEAVRGALGL